MAKPQTNADFLADFEAQYSQPNSFLNDFENQYKIGIGSTPKVQEEKGFLSNVGSLIGRGSESALASAEVSPAILAGTAPEKKAGIIAKELSTPQPVAPKELKEAQTAFLDEAAAMDKAKHWYSPEGLMAGANFIGEFGKQVLTNPKGAAYLTAQSAANMAPAIVGMLIGGRTGAAVGSVVPVVGTAVGATTGAIVGGFTGQVPLETGSEFIGLVGKELSARGMEPTEANVTALLKDKKFVDKAISDARTKGITTAAVDSATTLLGGRIASGPRRAAVEAARRELGAGADAARLAERAAEIIKETPRLQKISAGAKGVALDVAGGGASEAAGQQLAYGKVDLSDVGQEMLGELGGAAIEVPVAAYSATRDLVSRQGAVPPGGAVPPAAGIPPVTSGTPAPPPVATGPAVIADEDIESLDEEAPIEAPATTPPVKFDAARAQKLKNSIAEGEMIFKSGKRTDGTKMSKDELDAVKRSIDNEKIKLNQVMQPDATVTPVTDVAPPVVKIPVTTNAEEQQAAIDAMKALPVGGMIEMNGATYRKNEASGYDIVSTTTPAAAPTPVAPLHTAVNNEAKMEASVYAKDDGTFNVAQKDLESGETLPTFKNFKTQQEAVDYANTINLPKKPATKKPVFTKAPSDPALEAEAITLADRAEAAGQKLFADGIRSRVNNRGGINKPAEIDFLRSRVKDYESQKGITETPKQTLSLENFVEGYARDTKRYEQYKDSPEITKSNEYIQLLTDKINELGFKVEDVNPTSPPEVQKLKEKISQIAGSTTSFMKKNEAIDKDYKRADPARKESINSQLAKDFAEVDALLGIEPEEQNNLTPAEDWNLTVKNLSSVSNFPNVPFEELTPDLQEKIAATQKKDGKLGGKNIMQFGPAIEKQLKIKANLARQAEQKAKVEEGKNAEAEFFKRVEASKEELRSWLPDFGWATEGGRIIRDPDTNEVIGRTTWEAKNEYLDSVRSSLGRSFNVIKESVEMAIAGKKLNAKQMNDVNAVIDLFDELKSEFSTELTEDEINAELDIASQEQREDYIESKVYTPETEEAPATSGAKTEELELKGQTEAEIKADEAKAKAEAEAKAKEEAKAEQKLKAEKETFTLTGSDREADKAAAAGAVDLFAPKKEKAATLHEPAEGYTAEQVAADENITEPDLIRLNKHLSTVEEIYKELIPLNEKINNLTKPRREYISRSRELNSNLMGLHYYVAGAAGDSNSAPKTKIGRLVLEALLFPAPARLQALKDYVAKLGKQETKLVGTTTEDGFKIKEPIMVGLVDSGYEMLALDDEKSYKDNAGESHRSFIKDGVRVSITPQKAIAVQIDKPYKGVQTYRGNDDDMVIENIYVEPSKRKTGAASAAMKQLVELADKNNVKLYVEPVQLDKTGMTKEQLSAFYSKFGFELQNKEDGRVLVRAPKKEEAPKAKAEEPKYYKYTTREQVHKDAEAIKNMDADVRDNTEIGDFPGSADGYDMYEAKKMLPKPSDKLKKITTDNSFHLYQNYDYIANIDGEMYGITKQEDPDDPDNEQAFVFHYNRMDEPVGYNHETWTSDPKELINEIKNEATKTDEFKTIAEPVINKFVEEALDGFLVGDAVRFGNSPGVVVGLEGDYVKFRPDSARSPKAYQRVLKSQLTLVSRPDTASTASASKEESKFGIEKGEFRIDREEMFMTMGASKYSATIVDMSVKELLQNAFDAVKGAVLTDAIKEGDIVIDIDYENRSIKITDNAKGMTRDIVQDAFFTVAGSDKTDLPPEERSGGFGIAKVGFMLSCKKIVLNTVRDGVRIKVDATPKEIISNNFDIVKTPAPKNEHGTSVEIFVPESYTSDDGSTKDIYFPYSLSSITPLTKPLVGPAKVTVNFKKYSETETTVLPIGVNFDKKEMPLLTKAKFSWGTADIYLSASRPRYPKHEVLSSGVYQFERRFSLNKQETIPYDVIVNIKPTSKAKSLDYPFEDNRERFKDRISKDIDALEAYLARVARGEEAKELQENFKGIVSMPRVEAGEDLVEVSKKLHKVFNERYTQPNFELAKLPDVVNIADNIVSDTKGNIIVDTNKERETKKESTFEAENEVASRDKFMIKMEQDPKLPIFHNNTNIDYISVGKPYGDPEQFFAELGTLMVEMKEELGKSNIWGYDTLSPENLFFAGVSVDKKYGGVHIKVPYKAVLFNPFYDWGAKTLFGVRQNFLNTMIHEIAHTGDMDHGVGHNGQMIKVEQYLADNGLLDYYRDAILDVLVRHESTFTAMREAYGKSTTQNTAKSLEDYAKGAASARGDEGGGENEVRPVPAGRRQAGDGDIQADNGVNQQGKLGKPTGKPYNAEEDENLVDEIGVPAVPSHTTRTAKEFLFGGFKKTQQTAIDIANEPKSNVTTALSKAGDLVTLGRIRNIWYGAGLDAADFAKYGGQIRDAMGRLLPSIALKNAIKAAYISTRVILDGGLEMSERHGIFMAVKKEHSMANVFKLQAKLRKKMGIKLADRVVNGYFIAKRSRSIQNNYFDVSAQVRMLEAELLTETDPELIDELSSELASLETELKNIKIAYQKIPAFLCKIDEDEPTITTGDGKEIPNVLYDDDGLPLLNDDAMDNLINQDVKHPELKEMMVNWTAVNHNMLDMMAFSGRISQKEADKLKSIKDYSPWARLVDERQGLYDARAISANTSGIKHFKPGRTELDVDNVIESMTHNIQSMVKSSVRTYAYNRIAIEYGTRKPSTIDKKTGLEKPGKLKVYPQEGRFEEGIRIPIFANGRRIIIQIEDTNVAEAMLGLAMGPIDFPMQNVLSAAANLTRRTITFSLYFQAKQVFYDAPTAAWVSGVKNPFKLWAGCFSAFARSVVNPDNVTAEVLKSAGFGGFQSHHRSAKGELELELGIMNRSLLSKFLKGIDHFGDASDLSQRIPIYEQTLAETNDPMLAILKASDVMDFQKSGNGKTAQALKVTVPFMQAYATQLDALGQAAIGGNLKGMSRKEAKAQFNKTGALLAVTCLAYAFIAGGDDDYWELDDNTRLRNFYIPGSKKLFGHHVLIPMHSTASYFFKAIPEMLYSTVTSQGTKNEIDMKRLRTVLADSAYDSLLGPTPIPSGARPFIEIAFNHDFFTGGNVTPRSLEKLDAARQYNASTSEMGKMLSGLTGTDKHRLLNPIEADKLMRGMLGSVGALSMYYSNVIFGEDRVAPQLKDNPLLGGIIGADVQRKNEELVYTLAEITNKADATFKDLHKKGFHEEAREYFKENEDLIKVDGYVKSTTQKLDDLNAEIKRIGGSPNDKTYNTPEKRLAYINKLKEKKNEVLKDVIKFRLKAGL